MSPVERVSEELRSLGYKPQLLHFEETGLGGFVVIDYNAPVGRYKGRKFRVGIGFQEDGYPEYPPHFIAVANLEAPKLPVYSSQHLGSDTWSLFSVPPSDFWDSLPSSSKNMKTYLLRHVMRFWSQM